MEENQVQSELLQSVLQELQTLNQNFSDYRVYIEERNMQADEKALQEEQAKAEVEAQQALEKQQAEEAKQAEAEKAVSEQAETDPLMEKVASINDTLTGYVKKYETTSGTAENIEYNTSYLFSVQCIMLGVVTLFAGFFFARSAFKKL